MNLIHPITIAPIEMIEKDEIWKPLICYNIIPGNYSISSFGRIKNEYTGFTSFG